MEEVERDLIIETLTHCLGNRTRAAEILGISIRTLRNKLHEYRAQGVAGAGAPAAGLLPAPGPWPAMAPLADGRHRAAGLAAGVRTGGDVALALGVAVLLAVLVVPLPTLLLDLGAGAVHHRLRADPDGRAVPDAAARLHRLPALLLLTTLLRLALNVATTRTILTPRP